MIKNKTFIILGIFFSLIFPLITGAVSSSPSPVTTLVASTTDSSTVNLSWKSPGDNTPIEPRYVIVVSVDGMGSEYIKPLLVTGVNNELTTFKMIQREGVGTLNARNDYTYSITLPNHTTMITSRPVSGTEGHNWTNNGEPGAPATIHDNKGSYVESVFDVVHDNGMSTGIWSGKYKFALYTNSYTNKIDYSYINDEVDASTLTTDFINKMNSNPLRFSFVHYQDPDMAGHGQGWSTDPTSAYATALKSVDTALGNIIAAIKANPTLNGHTTILITADHGGHDHGHSDTADYLNYTIPLYAWGAGVTPGEDIYNLNLSTRTAPGEFVNPSYSGSQPIRDGDVGNLALDWLGMRAIASSSINASQDLETMVDGRVSSYDIRYSLSPIDESNWSSATSVNNEPSPSSIGSTDLFTVTSLNPNTAYYFAIKTIDRSSNISEISNIAVATTSAAAVVEVTTESTSQPSGGGGGGGSSSVRSEVTTVTNPNPVLSTVVAPTVPPTVTPVAASFTRDLRQGSNGEDVRSLQIYLNTHGFSVASTGAGSPGNETAVFGGLTRAALVRFQAANGIVPAVGYFGPITRQFVRK